MTDYLRKLPVDQTLPNSSELEIVNYIFGKDGKHKVAKNIVWEFKDAILGGIIFFLLSISYMDTIIKKIIPTTNNYILLLIIKTILFILIFWILKNIFLVKKSKN